MPSWMLQKSTRNPRVAKVKEELLSGLFSLDSILDPVLFMYYLL